MDRSLLPLRTALIFLLAALSGAMAGVLSWLAGEEFPRCVLAGMAVIGLAVPFFDRLIDSRDTGDAERRGHGNG